MSEEKPEYKTELDDALQMLGVGYGDEPAVIIEKPRKDIALRDDGLEEYQIWGWVKKSAKFIYHVRLLKGAKLSVWDVISLSINENGECDLPISVIAKLTGYSRSEVIESLAELEDMGYLAIRKQSGKKSIYKPSFTARGANSPTDEPVQKNDPSRKTTRPDRPLESADDPSRPPIETALPIPLRELKELIKSEKMKTSKGTDDIAYQIWKALKDSGANVSKKHLRIMRDELNDIDEGDDVKNKEWNLAHNFPSELEAVVQKLEKGLGLSNLMRGSEAVEVYRWISEQKGLDKFIEWATSPERVQYVGKYKKNIGLIKVEWKSAFFVTPSESRTSLLETITNDDFES